jgi:hypothetical protein
MWLDRYRDKERARANAKKSGARSRSKHRTVILERQRLRTRTDSVFAAKRRAFALQRGRAQRAEIEKLKAAPCLDCSRRFPPECMDFDHRDGTIKIATISQMIGRQFDQILAEIAKCDLICANCHRIRTRRRRRRTRG